VREEESNAKTPKEFTPDTEKLHRHYIRRHEESQRRKGTKGITGNAIQREEFTRRCD